MDRKNIDSISEEETLIVRSSERNPKIQDLSNTMNSKSMNQELPAQPIFSPSSPSRRKFADLMLSPMRYTKRKFRAGGTSGSMFSLIAVTLGTGTITFPYAIDQNGIVWGVILIIIGAAMSIYTGMLIVIASNHTNRHRYEDIALALYGKRMSLFTSIMNLLCLLGFIVAYIVYIKSAMITIIKIFDPSNSSFIVDDFWGQKFWGTLFSFGILFPMSIPRSINSLRFTSIFGVLCSVYLILAITIIFWADRTQVPDPFQKWADASYFRFTFSGIVSSVPLIIFAYMYQVNIPSIYFELEKRNQKVMSGVLFKGTIAAIILYACVGIFGYLTFLNTPIKISKNILEAYHDNLAITIGNFSLFFAVLTAAPLCVLPAKDTMEELFWKKTGMNKKVNLFVTLGVVFVCYLLSILLNSIGDAITLAGSTVNPMVGFIIPIIFYWKINEGRPLLSKQKLISLLVAVGIIIVSILGLVDFTLGKIDPNYNS